LLISVKNQTDMKYCTLVDCDFKVNNYEKNNLNLSHHPIIYSKYLFSITLNPLITLKQVLIMFFSNVQMETVDRLKSEKEDLEQEMRELTTRNEQLRTNNEVQGSDLVRNQEDQEQDDEARSEYIAMYEELKSNFEALAEQKEKQEKDVITSRRELVNHLDCSFI
jgi:hypothetical protein